MSFYLAVVSSNTSCAASGAAKLAWGSAGCGAGKLNWAAGAWCSGARGSLGGAVAFLPFFCCAAAAATGRLLAAFFGRCGGIAPVPMLVCAPATLGAVKSPRASGPLGFPAAAAEEGARGGRTDPALLPAGAKVYGGVGGVPE